MNNMETLNNQTDRLWIMCIFLIGKTVMHNNSYRIVCIKYLCGTKVNTDNFSGMGTNFQMVINKVFSGFVVPDIILSLVSFALIVSTWGARTLHSRKAGMVWGFEIFGIIIWTSPFMDWDHLHYSSRWIVSGGGLAWLGCALRWMVGWFPGTQCSGITGNQIRRVPTTCVLD